MLESNQRLRELDLFRRKLGISPNGFLYNPLKFSLPDGDLAVLDDLFSFREYNNFLKKFSAAGAIANPQAGTIQHITGTDSWNGYLTAAAWIKFITQADVLDEDNMVSDSAVSVSSQQAIKAFADNQSLMNLIKNGSFEDSALLFGTTPSGWTLEGTPTCAVDTGIGFGVPRAIKITGTGAANEGLNQTLSGLRASTVYTIIWDSKATAGDTARLFTTGGGVDADEDVVAVVWTNSSTTFTTDAGATNVVLKVVAKADTDIVWFDNIMVIEGDVAARYSQHPNDQHLKAIDYQSSAPANSDYSLLRIESGFADLVHVNANEISVTITFGTAFTAIIGVLFQPNATTLTGFTTNDWDKHYIHTMAANSVILIVRDDAGGFVGGDTMATVPWIAIGIN